MASRGVHLPLQVFYTKDKGYGVRCEQNIPSGEFVAMYVGLIQLCSEAETLNIEHNEDRYLFDLNHFHAVAQHVTRELAAPEAERTGDEAVRPPPPTAVTLV